MERIVFLFRGGSNLSLINVQLLSLYKSVTKGFFEWILIPQKHGRTLDLLVSVFNTESQFGDFSFTRAERVVE